MRENIRKVGNILISCPFLISPDLLSPLYSSPSPGFLTPQSQSDEIMESFTYDTRKMLLKGKGNKIFSALTQSVTCSFCCNSSQNAKKDFINVVGAKHRLVI